MSIEEQFNIIAKEYDLKRRIFIPCFEDFYINATNVLSQFIKEPKQILDLGAGTGLLSMYWYKNFPNAEFVLDDIATEMLNGAKKRFKGISNFSYTTEDYCKSLPPKNFDLIISALSIHHLDDNDKIKLFSEIYKKLPEGGAFINYDQFCFDNKKFSEFTDLHWINTLKNSELSEKDLELWKERRKLDKECSKEKELQMLAEIGFENPQCIYSNGKFSVLFAIR